MADPKIRIENLYKVFGPNPERAIGLVRDGISKQDLLEEHGHVLGVRNISLDMPGQSIQVVMGLSGSGKSTLIRHINRLIEPTAGSVIVDGQNVLEMSNKELRDFRRNRASMVFQSFALMPHRTVVQNIAYGLTIQGLDDDEIKRRVARWIERIELAGYEDHYPGHLSGGMQQRVGIGRALATDADILLMDEAFSALDPLIRYDMQSVLLDLQAELKKTIMFITHDLDEALRIGDSIAILRDGEIVQQGDPQSIVLHPVDDYVADFVKDINRGKVIKVGTIMRPPTDEAEGPAVDADTLLEDVARLMANERSGWARVIEASGQVVGVVSTADVMASMVRRANNGGAAKAAE
ncbi:MAG: glycine betaine/L-proline ABC transporter ATP-binding protein [Alphaproteobacteria bacterium]|nr:glycine betaine/L-proline ABC transporter ATP-binding protein [Alphaproteobacteria bacterium]MCZ6838791.1 glycine betaine/L-proline ABC transporter ATP-binding protein [Alphaproteobacteria bacterium]